MDREVENPLEISWDVGEDEDVQRNRSRSLTESDTQPLPSMTENGMRLGTPVAREAAKSFWSMDMLKTSLNRMAFYADCENHSQGSLGTPDSGFHSRVPSARSTPTVPQLPQITATSAPSSPQSTTKNERRSSFPPAEANSEETDAFLCPVFLRSVNESPLLVARRDRETATATSPTPNGNRSTSSLTSSSNTISPSHSSQALLPRRRQIGRSRSADHPKQLLLPQRRMRVAKSDSSVYLLETNASLMAELRRKTFESSLLYN